VLNDMKDFLILDFW